jgi:hypothetical protein
MLNRRGKNLVKADDNQLAVEVQMIVLPFAGCTCYRLALPLPYSHDSRAQHLPVS